MKFILEIELGNEEMIDGVDLAEKLHEVAGKVGDRFGAKPISDDNTIKALGGVMYSIADDNGNTVGKWSIKN